MLLSLGITNFALIDQLDIQFGAGLNVLTGETGAGKSIILDAIDVVLGGKVNQRMIRTGTQRTKIEAMFQGNPGVMEWLKGQEIEPFEDNTVVCSREIAMGEGSLRSRSRVNGVLMNRKLMRELRDRLVEITAQGQTMQLMVPEFQRMLLDNYGGKSLLKDKEAVATTYAQYQAAKKKLEQRQTSEQERLQKLDWLEYQYQELKEAHLENPQELEELEAERDRLSHVVELQQLSFKIGQTLYQNDTGALAATDLLGEGEGILEEMVTYDPQLEAILEMVKSALTQVVEAGQQMNAYGNSLESDPEKLTEVEERIQTLKQICRKYGPSLSEAIAHFQNLQTELEELTHKDQSLEELEQIYQQAHQTLMEVCENLTQSRQKAAHKLEKQLIKELKPLAMEKVQFECRFSLSPPNKEGADRVVYHFSPNPGEPLQPLSSTASGGEMSRFLLALKACFSQTQKSDRTLIFDEIDVGVSGKVAQAIAGKLHHLSHHHQVLCVTHQPLVAAMADVHFRITKELMDEESLLPHSEDNSPTLSEIRTVIRVSTLNEQQRKEELAQLAGGYSAQEAITFAQSLLSQAANYRNGKK